MFFFNEMDINWVVWDAGLVSKLFRDKYFLPIVKFSSNIYILFMIYFEAAKEPADRHLDLLL